MTDAQSSKRVYQDSRDLLEQVYEANHDEVLMLTGRSLVWAYVWAEAGHLYAIEENLFGFDGPRRTSARGVKRGINNSEEAEFVPRSETAAEELILNA